MVAVSRNLGGKIPEVDDVLSSHHLEIYPATSLDENCIEFEFQTDRNFYVDLRQAYLVLKLKFVKGLVYETYYSKEVEKEHKEKAKTHDEIPKEEEVEEAPAPLLTHVNNI